MIGWRTGCNADGVGLAYGTAAQASDAARSIGIITVHAVINRACRRAGCIINAGALIEFQLKYAQMIAQSVDGAKRTDNPAEWALRHCHPDQKYKQNRHLRHKQWTDHGAHMLIEQHQRYPGLKRAGRTEELAEPGLLGNCREDENYPDKDHIPQIFKTTRNTDFLHRQLIEHVLQKAERTRPAAYKTPEHSAQQAQKTDNIEGDIIAPVGCEVLQRADRTHKKRAGAGVAIKPRTGDQLETPLINSSADKPRKVGIIQNQTAELRKPLKKSYLHRASIQYRYNPGR